MGRMTVKALDNKACICVDLHDPWLQIVRTLRYQEKKKSVPLIQPASLSWAAQIINLQGVSEPPTHSGCKSLRLFSMREAGID